VAPGLFRAPRHGVVSAARRHREKILYLVVGGWNTLFSYACFALLYYLFQDDLHPSLILAMVYVLSSVNGFLGYRHIVFRSAGHPLAQYVRFQFVYLPLLLVNMVLLPLALAYTSLNAYVVQALFAVVTVVAGYLGNKHFAFRTGRPRDEPPAAPRGTGEPGGAA
jgi:putative flippase GtrA